jgi:hydrogenase expression/formation protein HypE
METGKIDRDFFREYIAPRLGASRDDVHTGPKHGVDFGVVSVGDHALVVATDPVSVLPALGYERAGRFAVRFVLADVAVSGIPPSHLAISVSLPPEMSDEAFAAVWRGVDEECRDLGVAVTTGHTARYTDASLPWVGAGTAFGAGDPADIVAPDGARPGDVLVVTKGPAVETTGLLTTLFPDQVDLSPETLSVAQERLTDTGVVRDALAASAAGAVSAMHDATEGGLLGALFEMADSAGVRLVVDSDSAPLLPGVRETCDALGIDPWRATTGGTLLLAADPSDAEGVVETLDEQGTPAAVVGRVESGEGVERDGRAAARPAGDASWPVYEQLLAAQESE